MPQVFWELECSERVEFSTVEQASVKGFAHWSVMGHPTFDGPVNTL